MADPTAGDGTEGLREALIATIREELDIGPRRWIGMLADALLAGPLARASAERARVEAERDEALQRSRTLYDDRTRECEAASRYWSEARRLNDNLNALARMYGEACGNLAQYRHAAVEWQGEQVDYAAAFESRVASLTAERDSLKAEITLLKKHIGALRDALDRSEARYAEAQNGPNG